MGADLGTGESRLASAIRIASADLSTYGASKDLFTVFTAANGIKRVTLREPSDQVDGFDSSHAIEALKGITPSYTGDRLVSALSTIVNSYDSIWLYTDRVVDGQPSASTRLKITTIPTDPDLARNVWLSDIKVRDVGGESNGSFIDLAVSNLGRIDGQECQIEAICFVNKDKPVEVERLSLDLIIAERVQSVPLGPLKSEWSYCKVQVKGLKSDLLASDNAAWVVKPQITTRVGLVSDTPLDLLGVDKLPIKGGVISTDLTSAVKTQLRGVIYHRSIPQPAPESVDLDSVAKATLIVYPAPHLKFNLAKVRGEIGAQLANKGANNGLGVEISRWDESHPVLRYARPALLELAKARILECTEGAKAIISSTAGPIACAGERDGKRHLILGFEVFPFDGPKNPTVSIITLNAINWLFNNEGIDLGGGVNLNIGAYGSLSLQQLYEGERFQLSYLASDGEISDNQRPDVAMLNSPGVLQFKLRSDVSQGSLGGGADTGIVALNSMVPEESDLLAAGVVNLPYDLVRSVELLDEARERDSDDSAVGSRREGVSYDGTLAVLALGVLLITLLFSRYLRGGY
jgi:hypothetical protein